MKKKTLTRFFGLALSAVMALTSIQVPALADDSDSSICLYEPERGRITALWQKIWKRSM